MGGFPLDCLGEFSSSRGGLSGRLRPPIPHIAKITPQSLYLVVHRVQSIAETGVELTDALAAEFGRLSACFGNSQNRSLGGLHRGAFSGGDGGAFGGAQHGEAGQCGVGGKGTAGAGREHSALLPTKNLSSP